MGEAKTKVKSFLRLARKIYNRCVNCLVLSAYRILYRNVEFGKGIEIHGHLIIKGAGKVKIGNHCFFGDSSGRPNKIWTFSKSATVTIGDHSYLNGIEIACRTSVTINRRCMIGDCLIMDTDFHSVQINRWNPLSTVKEEPINIGTNVWIGKQAIILRGVWIGNNSVVGAGTVLRKSIPANVVAVGNPQQVVKDLDTSIQPYEPD